ncbi:hypothetical protein SAMD00019534_125060 [Acytostelium subglobosum LB1]|uniref:hypothetical protein n=1 Tax=Acytostelium subglobosum LB1 TaxID=1410327 RepID=UPI000644CE9C|nr:hypothetical protein SAMD00019534_125060 [Acytostelium subglobosum LB1]GAM29330.1 hypothetical protein SAMD00019534_125060 [Acytostelium subglobosum LB1]|eukprot:XP_012747710.1 hypothetical protein SAMD00019534_125060 [Acytostelium subglobosum LB1]
MAQQTSIERDHTTNESLTDFVERRLLHSAHWYASHLHSLALPPSHIIFLSNNGNVDTIKGPLETMSVGQYSERFIKTRSSFAWELYESLAIAVKEKADQQASEAAASSLEGGEGKGSLYDRYWNDDTLQAEIKSGNIISGKIHINQFNRDEAFVKLPQNSVASTKATSANDKVLIVGRANINRAIHGDKVGVVLLPESQWIASDDNTGLALDQNDMDDELREEVQVQDEGAVSNTSSLSLSSRKATSTKYTMTGKVVGIIQRNWRDYVATIEARASLQSNYVFVVPLDSRLPLIRVPTKNSANFVGRRIVVRIDNWDINSNNPTGHFVQVLGESNNLETELKSLMLEHDVSIKTWSKQIADSLPVSSKDAPWQIPAEETAYRRTIAHHRTMSIDPLGSKDIDDAISVGYLTGRSGNMVEIGVHIADVSHFVREGSPLDQEARRRGTTIYLPDRRFDMLPAVLSEDVCSLRGGFPRCAMSVIWTFDLSTMTITDTWFGRTIIHSCAEMHYQLAQDIIDGKVVEGKDRDEDVTNGGKNAGYRHRLYNNVKIAELKKDLLTLRQVFRHLSAQRAKIGALDLESIEVRFQFNSDDTSKPDKIVLKSDLEVHSLVAEFMILANASVGTRIHAFYSGSALLRRHPMPNNLGFEAIRPLFDLCGFDLNTKTNKDLATSLQNAVKKEDPFINTILKLKTVNILSEAIYFSTGSLNVAEYYHYGLALDKYTHFTSPIRRYADIIVHRQLWDAINSRRNDVYTDHSMSKLADHLNLRHRASKTLQREATQMFQSLYFRIRPKQSVEAIVTDVRSNAVIVYVPEYGLRERIYLLDKERKAIPPSNDPLFGSSQSITDVKFNETNVDYTFNNGTHHQLLVFDHVLVDILTEDNEYRLPPVKLRLVSTLQSTMKNRSIKSEMKSKKNLVDDIKATELEQATSNTNTNATTESNTGVGGVYGEINAMKSFAKNDGGSLADGYNALEPSTYDLLMNIKQVEGATLLEMNGSRISYGKGRGGGSGSSNSTQGVTRLWSMSDSQTKDYRTRSDRYIRDAISKKYKQQQQQQQLSTKINNNNNGEDNYDDGEDYQSLMDGEDGYEKIAPVSSAQDKYKDMINRAEQSFAKVQRDLAKSKVTWNK